MDASDMEPDPSDPMTIRDIAGKAGVSTATVSRYLNGKILKERQKHKRLRAIISESGYQLPKRKVPRILFVKPSEAVFSNVDSSHEVLLDHLLQKCSRDEGVEVFSLCERDPERIVRQLKALKCTGVLSFADMGALPATVIQVNNDRPSDGNACVNSDNYAGMVQGLAYLKRMGHQQIAYLSDREPVPPYVDPRHVLVPQAYHAAGVEFRPELYWHQGFKPGEHQPVIEAAIERFLSLRPAPTAIFMSGDCYGFAVYDALRRRGKSVPDDISVLGFDDGPMCDVLSPALTTVAKPLEQMTIEALRLMKRLLEAPERAAVRVLVSPNIVERKSVRQRT